MTRCAPPDTGTQNGARMEGKNLQLHPVDQRATAARSAGAEER